MKFSAWRTGAPYYIPLLASGTGATALLWPMGYGPAGLLILAAGLFSLSFFRDPPRRISADPNDIVSPADGTVVAIEELADSPHYDGPCRRISIFLSVFNVHVNRVPAAGSVESVLYKRGQYKNAMNPESSKVNESNAVRFQTSHGPMTVRQVSGAIARRIVCLPSAGDTFDKGAKFGMIKFGSRTELYLPMEMAVCVKMRDKVKGGASVVAKRAQP
ncbi:MAG: phosphatidylserine decarboxylase [Candidatus Hydrogenedentes bacterium]|nr:phosphatidylserine decarboxylase [Candidatus Hydrogenedentota bacterium]